MYDQTKKASHVHNICKFMSLKNNAVIRTQSILEFDFCYHLEFNPHITHFSSQPLNLFYSFNGRQCRYTPDFLANYTNEDSTFFEVKHSSQILKSNFRARFAAKQSVCEHQLAKKLILITEKQIRAEPLFPNLKLIRRYAGLRTVTASEQAVLEFIQLKKNVQLIEVSKHLNLSEQKTLIASLCWIASGELKTDIGHALFGINNVVWCET